MQALLHLADSLVVDERPDFFEEDLARYRALDATDISSAVASFLPRGRRVEMTVLPEEKK